MKTVAVFLPMLFALVAGVPLEKIDLLRLDGRIVGGDPAIINDHPYQVALRMYNSHYCGGSIISSRFVLTAAHCLQRDPRLYKIRAGSTFTNLGGSVHTVKRFIVHENFSVNHLGVPRNDIGLIELNEPIEFTQLRSPIELFNSNEEAQVGDLAVVSGWGKTETGPTTTLNRVTVPVVPKDYCDRAYVKYGGLPQGQFCAAVSEGGHDACQGDSGGPMVIGGRLAGIVSWGRGCGFRGYPGVYTEVASYRNWIRKHAQI